MLMNLLDTNMNETTTDANAGGNSSTTNPLTKFGHILRAWQNPISTFGFVVAAVVAVGLLVVMMFAGEQMRARIKKHLVVIIACVVGLLSVSYIVSFASNSNTAHVFGTGTIAPFIRFHLSSLFPNL